MSLEGPYFSQILYSRKAESYQLKLACLPLLLVLKVDLKAHLLHARLR